MAIAYSIPKYPIPNIKMTTYLEAILVFYWYEFNIKNYNIETDQFSIVIGSEQFNYNQTKNTGPIQTLVVNYNKQYNDMAGSHFRFYFSMNFE